MWNMDTKPSKLLKYIISGLMIDWKCILCRLKNTIYLNFMNHINKKLSKVGFCNRNWKLNTLLDNNLSSFKSDQSSVVNVRST